MLKITRRTRSIVKIRIRTRNRLKIKVTEQKLDLGLEVRIALKNTLRTENMARLKIGKLGL